VRAVALVVIAALTACAGSPDATPTPEQQLPPRPDVPPGWREIRSDDGAVQLAVPADLTVIHTSESIHGFRDVEDADALDAVEVLTVAAIPPGQLIGPRGGESAAEWADAGGWLTPGQGSVGDAEIRSRDLLLPAGPTIELTSTFELGAQGVHWTMLHVIRTPLGYGLLQVSGPGLPPDQASDEVKLMRQLVGFGA
jgi:hypothetical protein